MKNKLLPIFGLFGVSTALNAIVLGIDFDNYGGLTEFDTPPFALDVSTITGTYEDPNLQSVVLTSSFAEAAYQSGFYRFVREALPATQVTGGPYLEFTLAPTSGNAITLDAVDSIQFYSRTYDTDADFSAGVFLATSLDGFSSTYLEKDAFDDGKVRSFDLGSGFASISSPITIRIYVYDTDEVGSVALRRGGDINETNYDLIVNGSISPVTSGVTAPEIELVVSTGTDPEISFPTESGATYQLQKSSDLSPGGWSDVAGQSVAGDGLVQTLSDPAGNPASGQKAFYRIVAN